MKTTNELRKQEVKTAKTIEIKVALPWVLLVLGIAILASHINGWNMRSENLSQVKAEAHSIVELTKVPSKK